MSDQSSSTATVRVDKWLWAIRLYKTRSMATAACVGGHVSVGGRTVKSAHKLKIGDHVCALTAGGPREVEVAGLADRRGSAAVAATLYIDHTPPPPDDLPRALRERIGERPTKRNRRLQDRLRRG